MEKEKKIHLEGAKFYGLQDYEVVDEMKILKEENGTLKDNVEFLHSCLDDRDKSIAIMQEENKKLKEEIEKLNLHIEAKDEAYMKLLKDYERLKDDREYMKEKLENDLGEMLYYVNQDF